MPLLGKFIPKSFAEKAAVQGKKSGDIDFSVSPVTPICARNAF